MELPNIKKELLRPTHKLIIGDGLMECDRFKTFWHIYEITEWDGLEYFYVKVIDSSDKKRIGSSVGCDLKAHTLHKYYTVLTYYLPNYKVLYAKKG